MACLISAANIDEHEDLVRAMHVDRKRIFIDWLGWDLSSDGDEERDQFDDDEAVYLIIRAPGGTGHLGSVRLLRTDRPHLLGDVFPGLCSNGVPRSRRIMEATRLCISPDCPKEDRRAVRRAIVCAMAEYALLTGLQSYTLITEMSFLARIAAVGWRCEMLGMPVANGTQSLGALRLHIDARTIPDLRRAGIYSGPVIELDAHREAA